MVTHTTRRDAIWAVADAPLGPWHHASSEADRLLATTSGGYVGPGHNSLTTDLSGRDVIAFHAWDEPRQARQLHLHVEFERNGPVLVGGLLQTDADPSGSGVVS